MRGLPFVVVFYLFIFFDFKNKYDVKFLLLP